MGSELQFDFSWALEGRPQLQLFAHRVEHRLIGMAQADSAQRQGAVNVFIAIQIPHSAMLATLYGRRGQSGELIVALGVGVCATDDAAMDFGAIAVRSLEVRDGPIGKAIADGHGGAADCWWDGWYE